MEDNLWRNKITGTLYQHMGAKRDRVGRPYVMMRSSKGNVVVRVHPAALIKKGGDWEKVEEVVSHS